MNPPYQKFLFAVLLIFLQFQLACQPTTKTPFSGKITYEVTYTSNYPGIMTSDSLTTFYGNRKVLFIEDSNYLFEMNGTNAHFSLYDPIKEIIYNNENGSDTVYYFDATKNGKDSILQFNLEKNVFVINGIQCDRLEITTKYTIVTYFFNEDYFLDANHFKSHAYDNWNFYLSKSNAVPLQIIYKNNMFSYVMTAMKIEQTDVGNSLFEINPNWVQLKGLMF